MKKRIGYSLLAFILLAHISACGSSTSSGGNGNLDTPSANSTKSVASYMKLLSFGASIYVIILANIQSSVPQIAKNLSTNCKPGTNFAGYDCTLSDGLGQSCTVIGNATETLSEFNFNLNCVNFHMDEDTTLNGSVDITAQLASDTNPMIVNDLTFQRANTTKASTNECTINESDTSFNGCVEGGTCSFDAANLYFSANATISSGGLSIIDQCGTYNFEPDLNMTAHVCLDDSNYMIDLTVQGIFNGQDTDISPKWTCSDLI